MPPEPRTGAPLGMMIDAKLNMAKLQAVEAEIGERKTLDTIAQRLLGWTTTNIARAGRDEFPWQKMALVTIAARPLRPSRHHFSSPYQTLLQQSFTAKIMGGEVGVGTEAKYAAFHHFGARRGRWVLPARKMLPSVRMARTLANEVMRAMVQTVRAIGNRE